MRAAILLALVACGTAAPPPRAQRISASRVTTTVPLPATGTGTATTLAKWTGTTTLGNSSFAEVAATTTLSTSYDLVVNGATLTLPTLETERLGIGTTGPNEQFHVKSNVDANFRQDTYTNTAAASSEQYAERSQGTATAPLAMGNAERTGRWGAGGYDGTAFRDGGDVIFKTDATPAANQMPIAMYFETSPLTSPSGVHSHLKIGSDGHISALTDNPTLSSCGTSPAFSPSAGFSDMAAGITTGTTATGCTVTWSHTYTNTPTCVVHCREGLTFSYATSTTGLTITFITAVAGDHFDFVCIGHET